MLHALKPKVGRYAKDQREDFCKCGRIALQNINRKYGKGMDIAAYHFPGLKRSVVNKGYYWDPGF